MDNLSQSAEPAPRGRKPRGGCLKLVVVSGIALLAVLHFIAPFIVRNAANRVLPAALQTPGEVGGVAINLALGKFGVRNLRIQQPNGFEGGDLLTVGSAEVSISPVSAVRQNPILVRQVRVRDLALKLIRDAEGTLNVTRLGSQNPTAPDAAPEPTVETEPSRPAPPIQFQKIILDQLTLAFQDAAKDWEISVENMRLDVRGLNIGTAADSPRSTITGSLKIRSPASRAAAEFRLIARMGVLQPDAPDKAPPIRLALGLIGFDLAAIDPLLSPSPAAAKATLGGGGIDFVLFLDLAEGNALANQPIQGRYLLTTDGGREYKGDLGGTALKPELPFVSIFSNLVGTQLGRVTDLTTNVAEGALGAAEGVANTGVTAVKGAAGAVRNLGSGLWRTAKGVATLDSGEALGGLKDSTVGTVGAVADTLSDTAGSAVGTLQGTLDTVTGRDDVRKWWGDMDRRLARFEAEAAHWIDGF